MIHAISAFFLNISNILRRGSKLLIIAVYHRISSTREIIISRMLLWNLSAIRTARIVICKLICSIHYISYRVVFSVRIYKLSVLFCCQPCIILISSVINVSMIAISSVPFSDSNIIMCMRRNSVISHKVSHPSQNFPYYFSFYQIRNSYFSPYKCNSTGNIINALKPYIVGFIKIY